MLLDEQKESLENKASEMMNNGFNALYEKYLQEVVESTDITNEDISEADTFMREKIKELI